jgi:hypothetical protein
MNKLLGVVIAGCLSVMPALLCGFLEQTKDRSSISLAEKENPPTQKTPHLRKTGRAFLESALLLAGSTTDYWRTYHDFKEDWQFRFTWEDQAGVSLPRSRPNSTPTVSGLTIPTLLRAPTITVVPGPTA